MKKNLTAMPGFVIATLIFIFMLLSAGGSQAAGWSAAGSLTAARDSHSATLLPDGRVLVAGGYNNSTDKLASAELYDPSSNTWFAAGSLTAARESHSATLLPDGRVLVAGGRYNTGYLASAELYDPSSSTWSAAGSLAAARSYHSATLLPDGRVLVAGGYNNSTGQLASVELYDPSSNTWSAAGSLATARFGHSATLLPDGRVLVAGGYNNSTGQLASAELYDPSSNTWSAAGALAAARDSHSATLLPDGRVLVAGGWNTGFLASAELYDPSNNTWSAAGPLAAARVAHSATLLPDGRVLVAGGNGSGYSLASAELYDPSSNTWSAAGSLATARSYHSATLLPDGRVLVAGGDNNSTGQLASAELYDPSSNTWSAAGALAAARGWLSSTLLPDGRVLVAGGVDSGYSLASAELYDPSSNTWSAAGSLTAARESHSATLLPDGRVLVAGGNISTACELYDPSSNTWSAAGSLAAARYFHSATLLPGGRVLVAGGRDSTGSLASAELYDPSSNTWSAAGSLTAARHSHSATLLPDGRVLVAGGWNTGSLASAELYDPSSNTWSAAGSLTAARVEHSATLLPDGRVLVAGGQGIQDYLAGAELYDPSSNTWSAAGSMAAARHSHSATLLPDGRVLVAGGWSTGSLASAELYDPSSNTWSAAGSLTAARDSHSATLLPDGRILVVGGFDSTGSLASAELYDKGLGFDNDWRPTLSTVSSPLTLSAPFSIAGTGFRGVGNTEASSGGLQSSVTNYPLVQIRSAGNDQTKWLQPSSFTATSYAGRAIGNFPAGPAWLTIYVNGIPSLARYVLVPNQSYSVTYNGNGCDGGTVPVDVNTYSNGDTVTVLGNTGSLTRIGSSFSGWNTAADGSGTGYSGGDTFSMPAADTTLYAQWIINSYSVAYNGNGSDGGTVPVDPASPHGYNTMVTVLGNTGLLTRTGFSFSGWNTAADGSGSAYAPAATFSMPANNVTLYAQWTITSYSVNYNGNGSDGGAVPIDPASPHGYNTMVTVLGAGTMTRTGSSFSGWNTAADGSGAGYAPATTFSMPANNVTLYAQWTINSYNVSYNGNGSDGGAVPVDPASPHDYNTLVTVLGNTGLLTRTGYSISGWNTAADGSGSAYAPAATFSMPANNVILYAQWTINSYTLTVTITNVSSGKGSAASSPAGIDCGSDCSETYTYSTAVILTATPENHSRFTGWSGDPDCEDGEVTITADVQCTANFYRFPWMLHLPALTIKASMQ